MPSKLIKQGTSVREWTLGTVRFTEIPSEVFKSLGKGVAWFPAGSSHSTEISKTPSWSYTLWLRSKHFSELGETDCDKQHSQCIAFGSMLRCHLWWLSCLNLPPSLGTSYSFIWIYFFRMTHLFFPMLHLTYHIVYSLIIFTCLSLPSKI